MLIPTEEQLGILQAAGELKPIFSGRTEEITLHLTANSTYLITVKGEEK